VHDAAALAGKALAWKSFGKKPAPLFEIVNLERTISGRVPTTGSRTGYMTAPSLHDVFPIAND
jgi:hypothetical protein